MKIGFWTVLLLGICVAAIALSYSYFRVYSPNKTEAGYNVELADQLEQVANKKRSAEERVRKANQMVAERENRWSQMVLQRTKPESLAGGGIDLGVQGFQLALDVHQYRDNIQRLINSRMTLGGVQLVGNGPLVPIISQQEPGPILSSFFNYPAIPFPVVIFDFGTITVQGTYKQIVDHVMSWKELPGFIAVTHGLNFTGTSPVLTGRYQLSVIGYVRASTVYPVLPGQVTGGSGGGSGGGGGSNRPRGGGRARAN